MRPTRSEPASAVRKVELNEPYFAGIKPSIQEKSCDVEFGTTGVQFPFWFLLQAYPTDAQPFGGPPKLSSGEVGVPS